MEESDENITVLDVDSLEECDSLVFTGHDNISKTNSHNDSSPYTLDNESLIIVEEFETNIPEKKYTKSDNLEDDSEILTRQKENDSLDLKRFIIPKNNPSSNTLLKSNQAKILSTATVNRPKTTTTHSQSEFSDTTELGHNKSFLKPNQQLKTTSSKESKPDFFSVPHNAIDDIKIPTKTQVQDKEQAQNMITNPTPNEHEVGDFFHTENSYQSANIEETKNVEYEIVDISKNPSCYRVVRTFDLIYGSKNKKHIPRTVASKAKIEKNSNIFVQNGEIKVNTDCLQNTSASFLIYI